MIKKDKGNKKGKSPFGNRKNGLKHQDHRLDRNATKQLLREGRYDDLTGKVKTKQANPRDWF